MIKVAFCDDNEEILNTIKGIVKKMHIDKDEVSYSYYSNPEILKSDNDKDVFDAIFLDIQMPEMDGMELADELRKNSRDVYISFLTNRDDLVFKSFEYQPFAFIRKEEVNDELPGVLRRLLDRLHEDMVFCDPFITDSGEKILAGRILYIESYKHYLKVFHNNTMTQVRGKISDVEGLLSPYGFIRVHSGFLVNVKYIYSFSKTEIIMDNKQHIPIGRKWKEEAMKQYKLVKRRYLYGSRI